MKLSLKEGRYVIAVSGGLDSMVLLDILAKQSLTTSRQSLVKRKKAAPKIKDWRLVTRESTSSLEFVVAHFNHGIRSDSVKDEQLVTSVAKKHGLKLQVGHGRLGKNASEAKARLTRYDFLESVRQKYRAQAIITAHHQDDLIETAFLNILRGSGPTGLTAIMSNPKVLRPLINVPRQAIEGYAKKNRIKWREDPTNERDTYLRNYLRHHLTSVIRPPERKIIISEIEKVAKKSQERNKLIATISQYVTSKENIRRSRFIGLPQEIADELVRYWLRLIPVTDVDRKTIYRLSISLKTARPGARIPVKKGVWLNFDSQKAYFTTGQPLRKFQLDS